MLPNSLKGVSKRCPSFDRRAIVLPLVILGAVGFLINTHISFITSRDDMCIQKFNIVFLKTHKCAGSSIQNILMRYGDTRNLTFVLPSKGNYLGHPATFSRALVPTPRLPVYNILAHHTRLDYHAIRSLMPPDSVFITIIRNPVEIFESSYSYYGMEEFFGWDIHRFVKLLPKIGKKALQVRFHGKFGVNQMLFDLGVPPSAFTNKSLTLSHIRRIETWFDLVLVAERMDESLILLRHLLCWDLDDVVTFKLNARNPKFKSSLSDEETLRLRDLNKADVMLYNRFLARFEAHIEEFGRSRMAVETAALRERTQQWYDLCVKGEEQLVSHRPNPQYYYNPRVMTFEPRTNVSNETCMLLTMEELAFTDRLRERQLESVPQITSTSNTNNSLNYKNNSKKYI